MLSWIIWSYAASVDYDSYYMDVPNLLVLIEKVDNSVQVEYCDIDITRIDRDGSRVPGSPRSDVGNKLHHHRDLLVEIDYVWKNWQQ